MVRNGRVAWLVGVVAVASIAAPPPAPVQKPKLPLLNEGKKDQWGVPTLTADKLVLRKMFFERRFTELVATLEALQSLSESDCQLELVGLDAFEALEPLSARDEPLVEALVASAPKSYAALVVRGLFRMGKAFEARGPQWADETTEAQWRGMREAAAIARRDLDASLSIHPTFAARRGLMKLNMVTSHDDPSQLALALKQCPGSLQMNIKAVSQMNPRYGGSYEAMRDFAAKAPVALNPKLTVLRGMASLEKCTTTADHRVALQHCEKALEAGPYFDFLYAQAEILRELGKLQEALAALDQAIEARPQKPYVHLQRAYVLHDLGREKEALAARKLALDLGAVLPPPPR
jgi:tetratricopeptide (TPR) repeat protein